MKSFKLFALLGLVLFVAHAQADCGDESNNSDDGDVKQWFKNIGCKIQKGAEDLQESAKPWADKVSSAAKDLGSSVSQKYDELKHKLTDDDKPASSTPFPVANAPTEKVPLAPLSGSHDNAAAPSVAPVADPSGLAGVVAGKDA